MAVVSAWSTKPGSWALDAEAEPAEPAAADFPSLSAAAATKVPKKKKPQPISLAEFTNGPAKPSQAAPTRLTIDEKLALPTGPRERSAEELDRPRGFGSYGDRSGGRNRNDDEPRRERSERSDNGPSRADEADDWGKMKKSAAPEGRRGGSAFYDSNANPSRADDSDRWTSNKRDVLTPSDSRRSGSNSWGFGKERDLSGDSWGRKREEVGNGGTSTGSGARPRLVLQPRTLPVVVEPIPDVTPPQNDQLAIQFNQISESGSSGRNKGANPFGAARPREEVLAEKGQDWRKIDEKLESVKLEEKSSFGLKKVSEGNGNTSESRTESAWRKPIQLVEKIAEPESLENGKEEKEEGTVEN